MHANIALNCNLASGNRIVAPFQFVLNNQRVECAILDHNDRTGKLIKYAQAQLPLRRRVRRDSGWEAILKET
jgi:hypothetical protein